jgi:hypothetical protein
MSIVAVRLIMIRGAETLGTRSSQWLNFVCWRLMLVDPQYGTCLMSPFWRIEFSGDS